MGSLSRLPLIESQTSLCSKRETLSWLEWRWPGTNPAFPKKRTQPGKQEQVKEGGQRGRSCFCVIQDLGLDS